VVLVPLVPKLAGENLSYLPSIDRLSDGSIALSTGPGPRGRKKLIYVQIVTLQKQVAKI